MSKGLIALLNRLLKGLRKFMANEIGNGFIPETPPIVHPPYAIGDMLIARSSTALSRMALGSVGEFLVAGVAGIPEWLDYYAALELAGAGMRGTTGGYNRSYVEAVGASYPPMSAAPVFGIAANVPINSRILGCQLRVDTAFPGGDMWTAAYFNGSTASITSTAQSGAKNTKLDVMAGDIITTNTTWIGISKDGPGDFSYGGSIRAIIYYEAFTATSNA
jgi:hypothetical protein